MDVGNQVCSKSGHGKSGITGVKFQYNFFIYVTIIIINHMVLTSYINGQFLY